MHQHLRNDKSIIPPCSLSESGHSDLGFYTTQRDAAPAAVAANSFGEGFAYGDGLEEADQVIRNSLIDYSKAGFGHWKGEIPPTKPNADRPAKAYADRLLGDPELTINFC
jgi:hypothetical protein